MSPLIPSDKLEGLTKHIQTSFDIPFGLVFSKAFIEKCTTMIWCMWGKNVIKKYNHKKHKKILIRNHNPVTASVLFLFLICLNSVSGILRKCREGDACTLKEGEAKMALQLTLHGNNRSNEVTPKNSKTRTLHIFLISSREIVPYNNASLLQ